MMLVRDEKPVMKIGAKSSIMERVTRDLNNINPENLNNKNITVASFKRNISLSSIKEKI